MNLTERKWISGSARFWNQSGYRHPDTLFYHFISHIYYQQTVITRPIAMLPVYDNKGGGIER